MVPFLLVSETGSGPAAEPVTDQYKQQSIRAKGPRFTKSKAADPDPRSER